VRLDRPVHFTEGSRRNRVATSFLDPTARCPGFAHPLHSNERQVFRRRTRSIASRTDSRWDKTGAPTDSGVLGLIVIHLIAELRLRSVSCITRVNHPRGFFRFRGRRGRVLPVASRVDCASARRAHTRAVIEERSFGHISLPCLGFRWTTD
jgi:hypothetical protein